MRGRLGNWSEWRLAPSDLAEWFGSRAAKVRILRSNSADWRCVGAIRIVSGAG